MKAVWIFASAIFAVMTSVADGRQIDPTGQNTIEIRVIVDKHAFEHWQTDLAFPEDSNDKGTDKKTQMTEYIRSLFAGLNAIFKPLEADGISMDARIVSIEYITDEIITKNVSAGNRIHRSLVLKEFESWLGKKEYTATDHCLLLTGLELTGKQGDAVAGVATVKGMCNGPHSLSAVEDSHNGATVVVLAHELGHSLGASHDGNNNNACDSTSSHIMNAATGKGSTKTFQYSRCAKKYIKDFLKSLKGKEGGSCLLDTKTETTKIKAKQLGELYDPDMVCRMTYGKQSFFGRTHYSPKEYAKVRSAIWCKNADGQFSSVVATDGFPCGKGKKCSLGLCLEAPSVLPNVSDTCPFGDSPSYADVEEGKSCQHLITTKKSSPCYQAPTSNACCASCEAADTGNEECKYGDKAVFCSTLPAGGCYANHEVCCGTCKKQETDDPDCKYGDQIDTSKCKKHIKENDRFCESNRSACCKSCKAK